MESSSDDSSSSDSDLEDSESDIDGSLFIGRNIKDFYIFGKLISRYFIIFIYKSKIFVNS